MMDKKLNISITPHAVDRFSIRGGMYKWHKGKQEGEGLYSFLVRFARTAVEIYCRKEYDLADIADVQMEYSGWILTFRLSYNSQDTRVQQWSLRTVCPLKKRPGVIPNV
jgi:hypothetical protein